jgi:glycosyltransferase involved in cell wall biosynthesis
MAVSEAIARGLPVVSTRTGAIPDLVGEDAGLLVGVEDEVALRDALRTMVTDDRVRTRCRAGAIIARERLRPWTAAAQRFADILAAIPGHA